MYLDGGWKPPQDPPAAKPSMSGRDEGTLMWLIVVAAIAFMVAPIGGATIVQAFSAM